MNSGKIDFNINLASSYETDSAKFSTKEEQHANSFKAISNLQLDSKLLERISTVELSNE